MIEKLLKPVVWLIILLLGYYIYLNIERRETVVNVGPTLDVVRNPYLAAGQFLQQQGKAATQHSKPPKSEDFHTDDMLIITDNRTLASRGVAVDLYEWVKSGGHLVWSVNRFHSERTNALSELTHITGYSVENEEGSDSTVDAGVFDELARDEDDEDKSISELLEEHNERLKKEPKQSPMVTEDEEELTPSQQVEKTIIDFELGKDIDRLTVLLGEQVSEDLFLDQGCSCFYLDHPSINSKASIPDVEVGSLADQTLLYTAGLLSREGKKLLHFKVGKGHMTVLASTSIWTNREIGRFDHAHFLQMLAGDSSQVIFQSNVEWPSLWQLLLDWALEFVVIVTVLFFAMLVKSGVRFGPIKVETLTTRRSIVEHITAMARFHWRHQHVGYLVSPLRAAINHKMRMIHSGYDQLNDHERYQLIAERVQLPVTDVEQVFVNQDKLTDGQFCQSIKLLEKIRKTL